jgi:hypothetical protein
MIAPAALMTVRVFLFAVLVCGAALAAPEPVRTASAPIAPPMTFYVVKGAPDSCGRGCDSWIEAEGQIDSTAAARFKTFLDGIRDPIPPIYFASPGGNVAQAILMGTTLHGRLTIARVGRTLAKECGFEAQDSDVCIKLKQSGRELHGDLLTRGALCASACPYVLAGAAVHEVAPDAALGVHSVRILLNFRVDQADPSAVSAANARGQARIERVIAEYLAQLGIDVGLLGLAKTISADNLHILTREEIVRFGLDRREFVETPWNFESRGRGMIDKVAVVRASGEASFRTIHWRVICFDANRFALDFQRPLSANPAFSSVSIAGGDAKPVFFGYPPVKASGQEQWVARMPRAAIQSLLDTPRVELTETSLAADGQRQRRTFTLSNDGVAFAMNSLMATCPPARDSSALHAIALPSSAAK